MASDRNLSPQLTVFQPKIWVVAQTTLTPGVGRISLKGSIFCRCLPDLEIVLLGDWKVQVEGFVYENNAELKIAYMCTQLSKIAKNWRNM
jgi:hypothetical protein